MRLQKLNKYLISLSLFQNLWKVTRKIEVFEYPRSLMNRNERIYDEIESKSIFKKIRTKKINFNTIDRRWFMLRRFLLKGCRIKTNKFFLVYSTIVKLILLTILYYFSSTSLITIDILTGYTFLKKCFSGQGLKK